MEDTLTLQVSQQSEFLRFQGADTGPMFVIRLARLAETIDIVKRWCAGDLFTYAGDHYSIQDVEGSPLPAQRPHPPILIGGGGPRLLTLAAQQADIVSIFPRLLPAGGQFDEDESTATAVAEKVRLLQRVAGDRFAALQLNVLVQDVIVTDDRRGEIERLERIRAQRGATDDGWLDSPYVFVGSVARIAEDIRAYRERLGVSYFIVFERVMDVFAPVVAALRGT